MKNSAGTKKRNLDFVETGQSWAKFAERDRRDGEGSLLIPKRRKQTKYHINGFIKEDEGRKGKRIEIRRRTDVVRER